MKRSLTNRVRLSVKNRLRFLSKKHLINEAVQLILIFLQDRKVLQIKGVGLPVVFLLQTFTNG